MSERDAPEPRASQAGRAAPLPPRVAALSPRLRGLLETLGVVLILVAALVPRLRDFSGGFDREFEGWQGAFFALSAINYERLGVGRHRGYPVQDVDLPGSREAAASSTTLYANHPPAVPLAAWASAKLLGPAGWSEAWRDGRAPEGLEPALRLPFVLAHLAGLVLLYLAVRAAAGARRAMLALAVLAATPVSILYATLVNYENPALAFVLGATLFHVRFLREGRGRDLAGYGLCALLGCAVTFFHLFFLPGLLLQALLRDRRRALQLALAASVGALIPLALHAWLSSTAFEDLGRSPALLAGRVKQMLAPLLDGSVPLVRWTSFQAERSQRFFSAPILLTALVGVLLAVLPRKRAERAERAAVRRPIELSLPLLAGGLLLLLVMYKHTADGWGGGDGQVPFLMYLAPGVAVAAALVLDLLARPLERLKGGIAPLVVATSLICLPGVARANELRRPLREPGPRDDPALSDGPATPLPRRLGLELAEVIPEGELAIYPTALGFTPAHIYYAWRTLIPVDPFQPDSAGPALAQLAARGRDAWLLLPRSPRREQAAVCSKLFALVKDAVPGADRDRPELEGEHWQAWRLPSD